MTDAPKICDCGCICRVCAQAHQSGFHSEACHAHMFPEQPQVKMTFAEWAASKGIFPEDSRQQQETYALMKVSYEAGVLAGAEHQREADAALAEQCCQCDTHPYQSLCPIPKAIRTSPLATPTTGRTA